ncbi:glutaredoxin [Phlebopus sp. FC_14]|nr:glutaredoxin [Phlebopus sp. FC_14]
MTSPENHVDVTSSEHFKQLLSKDLTRVSLINFWAPWAEPCKQMNEIVLELAKKYPELLALRVEAEEQPDITESFDINAVPSFLLIQGHTALGRVEGADAARLTDLIAKHVRTKSTITPLSTTNASSAPPPAEETEEELNARLRELMNQSNVVLFMKGSPDAPRCGFSKRAVALLREQKVEFSHFDILTDESVRQGLKVLNRWPTFPQIIVKGEFVGGLDVVTEMVENEEFAEIVA